MSPSSAGFVQCSHHPCTEEKLKGNNIIQVVIPDGHMLPLQRLSIHLWNMREGLKCCAFAFVALPYLCGWIDGRNVNWL